MSEMIERLARRMAELDKRDPDAHPTSEYDYRYAVPDIAHPANAKIWHQYAWKMRHIVRAMRDPTALMKGAFWEKSGVWIEEGNDRVAELWNAMLDAALAEPGTPVHGGEEQVRGTAGNAPG